MEWRYLFYARWNSMLLVIDYPLISKLWNQIKCASNNLGEIGFYGTVNQSRVNCFDIVL